jgi:hypothetical protein
MLIQRRHYKTARDFSTAPGMTEALWQLGQHLLPPRPSFVAAIIEALGKVYDAGDLADELEGVKK